MWWIKGMKPHIKREGNFMKFEEPKVEVIELVNADVVEASTCTGQGTEITDRDPITTGE